MKVSIITINLNNRKGLEKTVSSVTNQTYSNIEYIIIDGNSTDGSNEYLQQNGNCFSYWIAEDDTGIYNAMNKGIKKATGDYLLFLNSGDYLYKEDVIEKFVSIVPRSDVMYGDIMIEKKGNLFLKKAKSKVDFDLFFSSAIPHLATFTKAEVFEKYGGYNETNKIVSDWEYYFKLFVNTNATFKKVDITFSVFNLCGISSQKDLKQLHLDEREKVYEYLIPKKLHSIVESLSEYYYWKHNRLVNYTKKIHVILKKFKSNLIRIMK